MYKRVCKLSTEDVLTILSTEGGSTFSLIPKTSNQSEDITPELREKLNLILTYKLESEEIDEIELLIIELGY